MVMMFEEFILNDNLFFKSFKNLEPEVLSFWKFLNSQSYH
jgi:hypothetical protein